MTYAAIDFETTGRDPNRCQIVEIGAAIYSDDGTLITSSQWDCAFDPDVMEPSALAKHGIAEPAAHALNPDNAVEYMVDFVRPWASEERKVRIIGHNFAQYDLILAFRHVNKARWDDVFNYRICDTSVLGQALAATGIMDAHTGLQSLLDYFGIINERPHRACPDAMAEGKLWFAMVSLLESLHSVSHSHHEELSAGFACLRGVLDDAFAQALGGKGQERHGRGQDFHKQQWVQQRGLWGDGFLFGQMAKKAHEALGFDDAARFEREVFGSIIYAAMTIVARRMG
jgi:DNA polymerase III epsilon subunit-like protein